MRDKQFFEVYHPETGLPYGGMQEDPNAHEMKMFKPYGHQTWSAIGFISMVLYSIAGLKHKKGYIEFKPHLPSIIDYMEIKGIHYNDVIINIVIKGKGHNISRIEIDDEAVGSSVVFNNSKNTKNLKIIVSED